MVFYLCLDLKTKFNSLKSRSQCPLLQVTMKYVAGMAPGPDSLAAWCRRSIRSSVGKPGLERGDIGSLALPAAIKEFIMYR